VLKNVEKFHGFVRPWSYRHLSNPFYRQGEFHIELRSTAAPMPRKKLVTSCEDLRRTNRMRAYSSACIIPAYFLLFFP